MARIVRAALLQADWTGDKESMIAKHEKYAREAAKQGITVTTIGLGLGYNEDLMTKLALASTVITPFTILRICNCPVLRTVA